MKRKIPSPEQHHKDKLARLPCVVCARMNCDTPAQLHHVATGSSKRYWGALVPLCPRHHGEFHTFGARQFCRIYRVPWDKEEGLLVWVFEDLAKAEVLR